MSDPIPSATTDHPRVPADRRFGHRVMISGYYGFDNLGDELILEVLVNQLKARDFKITVLSNNPEQTRDKYGVNALHRMNWPDICDEMAKMHLFISGGGGLFQDVTGPGSTIYYGGLVHIAKFFEVPIFFWGQGVGPLKTYLGKKLTASAINHCRGVTVRDEASANLVEKITAEYGEPFRPEVTADPVWNYKVPNRQSARKKVKTWNIGVSLRPWKDLTSQRITALARSLKALADTSEQPVKFFLLPFQDSTDQDVLSAFETALRKEGIKNDDDPEGISIHWIEPNDIVKGIVKCHVLFGMRFHSILLALLGHVPVYGLVYDPKVRTVLSGFNLKGTDIDALETDTALQAEALSQYLENYPEINLKPYKTLAINNFRRLLETFQYEVDVNLIGLELDTTEADDDSHDDDETDDETI